MSTVREATVYALVGGDLGLRQLVKFFYQEMDRRPEAKVIRDMHPLSLDESEERLYWFLSGWMGGPPLYGEKRGHPMLRARHLPFAIGQTEAELWVACFQAALTRHLDSQPAWSQAPEARTKLEDELMRALQRVALHMMNQPASTSSISSVSSVSISSPSIPSDPSDQEAPNSKTE